MRLLRFARNDSGRSAARPTRTSGRIPARNYFFFEIALKIMVIIGIFLLSGGCALTTRDMVMYHTFNYPSPPRGNEPGVPETVMVYNFLVDPTVEMHALAISYSKDGQKSIMKHRWKDNPADMITELVLRDLANAGLFEKAVDQLGTGRYRYALEGVIHNLQGVVRNGKSSALIEIGATLVDFDAPPGKDKNLLKKTYRIEVPSTDDKPESMVAALNLGLRDFSAQLRNDIRAVLPRRLPKTKTGDRRTPTIQMPA